MPSPSPTPTRAWLLTIGVASIAGFAWLGAYALMEEEARYAEIAREVLVTGDWLVPRLNGVLYFEKPPLLAWLGASALGLAPRSPEWALRTIPALFTLGAVMAAFAFARRAGGAWLGAAAAIALAVLPLHAVMGRTFATDGPFSAALTIALAIAGIEVVASSARTGRLAAAGIALAAATLLRGPLAFALFVPVVAVAGLRRDGPALALRRVGVPALVAFVLAAPWFLAISIREPLFAHEFFVEQHFGRAVADAADKVMHHEPFWFYGPIVLAAAGPGALFLPWALGRALRRRREPVVGAGLGFALLAAGWILLFFTLLGGKRAAYLLPITPWIGFVLAAALEEARAGGRAAIVATWTALAPSFAAALGGATLVATGFTTNRGLIGTGPLVAGTLLLGTLSLAGLAALARRRLGASALALAFALAGGYGVMAASVPRMEGRGVAEVDLAVARIPLELGTLAIRTAAEHIAEIANPEDEIACLGRFRPAAAFYSGRLVRMYGSFGELRFGVDAEPHDPSIAARFHEARELDELLLGPRRAFVLTRDSSLFHPSEPDGDSSPLVPLPQWRDVPLHVVGRWGRIVVVSNRP